MPRTTPCSKLSSSQQIEVYDRLIQGMSNEEIAKQLRITARTVKFHIGGILRATGFTKRTELLAAHGRAITTSNPTGFRDDLQTARVKEVYDLLVQGRSHAEIAKKLGIAVRTVKFHSQLILEQLGFNTQARLIAAHWGSMVTGPTDVATAAVQQALDMARAERDRITDLIVSLELAAMTLER